MEQMQEFEIPSEWQSKIWREDGRRKKVILYGTSAGVLFRYGERAIVKMREIFCLFRENQEEVMMWWRPDAKTWDMLHRTKPEVWREYDLTLCEYRETGWGIYDDTPDFDRAVHFCDAYLGDGGSMANKCRLQEKAVMIQHIN